MDLSYLMADGFEGLLLGFFALLVVALIIALAVYIYASIALMTIAKKTKTKKAWLAWIPVANLYLITQIAKVPWWTMLIILLTWIHQISVLIVVGLTIYWWWNIAERRKMPGWLGILMAVPLVNIVVLGYIAWKK